MTNHDKFRVADVSALGRVNLVLSLCRNRRCDNGKKITAATSMCDLLRRNVVMGISQAQAVSLPLSHQRTALYQYDGITVDQAIPY